MDVLVPVDASDTSRRAVAFALEFAAGFDASLDLVHVSDRATDATRRILDESADLVDGTDAEVELVLSDDIGFRPREAVGEEITRLVEERGYDHVIMGHEPESDVLERAMIGSAADAVRRNLTVPVTIVS